MPASCSARISSSLSSPSDAHNWMDECRRMCRVGFAQFLHVSGGGLPSTGHQRETCHALGFIMPGMPQAFFFVHQVVHVCLGDFCSATTVHTTCRFSGHRPDLALMMEHMSNSSEARARVISWAASYSASLSGCTASHSASSLLMWLPRSTCSFNFCRVISFLGYVHG